MPEIVIRHYVNQGGMTTNYTHEELGITSLEQKRQRERELAMAQAEAVTSRYSHICGPNAKLPVQQHRQQLQQRKSSSSSPASCLSPQQESPSPTSTMKQAPPPPPPPRREPNTLVLGDSFRKSSHSVLSVEDENQDNGNSCQAAAAASIPPPPPLVTEVTAEILTPKLSQQKHVLGNLKDDDDYYNDKNDLGQEWVVTKRPSIGNFAARQERRRVSDSSAFFNATQGASLNQTFRDGRPSFQERTATIPTKLYPTKSTVQVQTATDLYQELLQHQQELWRSNATTTTGMTSQRTCSGRDHHDNMPPSVNTNTAVQEQEALWRELTKQQNNHNSISNDNSAHNLLYRFDEAATATTRNTTTSPLDPREEQAQLWEQIRRERLLQQQPQPQQSTTTTSSPPQSSRISALEEQTQLLEEIQRNARRNGTAPISGNNSMPPAVVEQERLLQALRRQPQPQRPSVSTTMAPPPKLSPIELQAQRLRQIQDEKEQEIVAMACKMSAAAALEDQSSHNSGSIPSLALSSGNEEDDLSLQYIMDLSRREAEAQSQVEEKALQLAMERSREDLGGIIVTTTTAADDNDEQQQQEEQEQREMLELRRSIAELACQVSEGTLDAAERNSSSLVRQRPTTTSTTTATLETPIAANRQRRRRQWGGLAAFRHR